MKQTLNPLKDIYYISIPESFSKSFNNITIDSEIKLPIETTDIANWNPENITWEAIISGMLKIMAYNREHQHIEYYRDFVKAIRPNIVQELTDSAIYKSTENDFELSKEIFLAIEGLEPEKDRNQLNLAVLFENQADFMAKNGNSEENISLLESAKEIYMKLLDKESVLSDTYFNSGYFFLKIRDFEKAELCLNAFIEYSDDENKVSKAKETLARYQSVVDNENIFNKAYNAILNEDEAYAINLITDFLTENDGVWNAWFLLGWAYRRLSNFTEAITALEKAYSINPDDADIHNESAICYLELHQYDKCQKSLERALKITPEDVKIISNMGILQMKLGNMETAKKYFETVLVYDEDDSIAKQYLEQL